MCDMCGHESSQLLLARKLIKCYVAKLNDSERSEYAAVREYARNSQWALTASICGYARSGFESILCAKWPSFSVFCTTDKYSPVACLSVCMVVPFIGLSTFIIEELNAVLASGRKTKAEDGIQYCYSLLISMFYLFQIWIGKKGGDGCCENRALAQSWPRSSIQTSFMSGSRGSLSLLRTLKLSRVTNRRTATGSPRRPRTNSSEKCPPPVRSVPR